MSLIHLDAKLCDIAVSDPSIVSVFNRFGIVLGVGDHTIASICRQLALEPEFFITILNTYLFPDYFPEKIMSSFKANVIISYLNKTNRYYEHFQLPNVERHFELLLHKSSTSNSNLQLMMNFFIEVKNELLNRIDDDRNRWFPEVLAKNNHVDDACVVSEFDEGNDTIEDKIDDLINMFVIHLKGDYDLNLCQAVLTVLFNLKKDITQNNRIRNRILKPLSTALSSQ